MFVLIRSFEFFMLGDYHHKVTCSSFSEKCESARGLKQLADLEFIRKRSSHPQIYSARQLPPDRKKMKPGVPTGLTKLRCDTNDIIMRGV